MLFNSYLFILLFLPITVIGYFFFNRIKRCDVAIAWLLVMSLIFYGYNHWNYMLLLGGSICFNFIVVKSMRSRKQWARKSLMIFAIMVNISVLFYFKYYNFFLENLNSIWKNQFVYKNIILPLGISFFTFQQISYVVDCYKDESLDYGILEYAAYIAFFPQLVAGPIVTHDEFIPQLQNERLKKVNFDNLSAGLYGFGLGLGKKVLLADNLSGIVQAGYQNIDELNAISACIIILSYTFQIYFDFSGYSDMATGIAKMMNFELPINFNSPYRAVSIGDFWKRWHMTLTRFLTKYIYFPMGGNRKGKTRTAINTLIVFLISGFWHGANWTFVIWGGLHGCFKIIERLGGKIFEKIPAWIRWFYTFIVVNLLWVYFRAENIKTANCLLKKVFCGGMGGIHQSILNVIINSVESNLLYNFCRGMGVNGFAIIVLSAFLILLLFISLQKQNLQMIIRNFQNTKKHMIVTITILYWCIMSLGSVSEFLYFNF